MCLWWAQMTCCQSICDFVIQGPSKIFLCHSCISNRMIILRILYWNATEAYSFLSFKKCMTHYKSSHLVCYSKCQILSVFARIILDLYTYIFIYLLCKCYFRNIMKVMLSLHFFFIRYLTKEYRYPQNYFY